MARADYFVVTCEHGGNRIPARYRRAFADAGALLQTHRGYDAGALALAREFASRLAAPLFFSTTSRLLVDLNRSIGHPRLYSEATRGMPGKVRKEILEAYYLPYRNKIEAEVAEAIARGRRVIHVASHSFTPVLSGIARNADIGLLYDPARPGEVETCRRWQAQLGVLAPGLKVRRNYPYTGKSDGLTAWLRRRFPVEAYIGIELEINQKHVLEGGRHWRDVRECVIEAFCQAMTHRSHPGHSISRSQRK